MASQQVPQPHAHASACPVLVALLTIAALAAWLPARADIPPPDAPEGQARAAKWKPSVAIPDFNEAAVPAEFRDAAGRACADAVAEELTRIGRLEVIARSRVLEAVQERDLERGSVLDAQAATRLGTKLSAKYVLFGEIRKLEIDPARPAPGIGAAPPPAPKGTTVSCEVSYRLIVSASGKATYDKVLKAKEQVRQVLTDSAPRLELAAKTLRSTGIEAARAITPPPPVEGLVASADGHSAVINVGAREGVSVGQRFTISRVIRDVRDPDTGQFIRHIYETVGAARCTEVRDRASFLEVTAGNARVGDRVQEEDDREVPREK